MLQFSKQRVIAGFNRREPSALTWIYESYYEMVCGIVNQSARRSPEAEDLIAEIFYKLMKYPGQFEKLKQIEYFLYKTAKNACLDYQKHQRVKQDRFTEIEQYQQQIAEGQIEAAVIREKFDSLMRVAAARLTPQYSQIIILAYGHGLGNQEIARRLGLSEKTVANRKTLALKTLKIALGGPGHNGFSDLFL